MSWIPLIGCTIVCSTANNTIAAQLCRTLVNWIWPVWWRPGNMHVTRGDVHALNAFSTQPSQQQHQIWITGTRG